MKCRNCKIEINSLSSNCPLCGSHLEEGTLIMEPAYPELEKMKGDVYDKPVRILLFITIVLSLSSFAANMLIPHVNLWSVVAIYGMWLAWLVVGLPIINRKMSLTVIILDYISVSIFLYMLDINFGHHGWALDYAVPFLICGSALVTTIVLLSVGIDWREFYLFELFIAIISFIPLILSRFMNFVMWPSIVSAIYGIVTIVGLLILGNRKLKQETKKRFHF